VVIKLFQWKKERSARRSSEHTIVGQTTESESSPLIPTDSPTTVVATPKRHSPAFDLGLARFSLLIDIVCYTAMGMVSSPLLFTGFGVLGALGSGFTPAIQSVALTLYTRRGGTESGKLFGGIAVVQALWWVSLLWSSGAGL